MKKCHRVLLTAVLVAMLAPAALAQEQQEDETTRLKVGGLYTAWFQNQQDFFFGKTEYDDRYAVQMLRLNVSFAVTNFMRAVTRFDMAQGWWGVDNEDWRGDYDPDDNASLSSRFGNKDTNYGLHVDIGFLEFAFPETPVTARVGRMYYGLGNKLVLDSNFDGIQVDFNTQVGKLGFAYAKVFEGIDGLSDLDLTDEGGPDAEDADLFYATFDRATEDGSLAYGLFGMYYMDNGDDDGATFMPNNIDYFRSRFTPNISTLGTIGLVLNYKNKGAGLNVLGEFEYLTGTDDVANVNSGPNQLLDVNNGDLSGYNLYVNASKSVGPKVNVGLVLGRGSGDDDLTSGKGNVNKLKTMGFFYVTEMWEDSIMPDEEGITPQGLGAPNTRGYRELENTTLIQGNVSFKPIPRLTLFGSYTYLMATEDIRGWGDANGDGVISPNEFTDVTSSELGQEVDFVVTYNLYKPLELALRGGYFMAGDAALLLINGTPQYDTNPWELKAMVTYKF